jgi:Cu/Ag efflux protein CusF
MKLLFPLFTFTLAVLASSARADHDHEHKPAEKSAAKKLKTYPVRGVIVEVQPKQSALLVKHEDIPGFMPAMTMLFKVDAATLEAAKKDQAIAATLVERDGDYWLIEVKPAS